MAPDDAAPAAAAQLAGPSRWAIFALADFWRIWFVGLVLFLVRWLEMLAMAIFVYDKTHSPFLVAMLTMLRLLPMALLGAFLGEIADRIERRTTLLFVVLCLFCTSSTLCFLAWTGVLQPWHLAVATFVNGTTWASDNPVRRILLGEVVGPDQIGRAMSMDVGSTNASRMLGPAIGGAILAVVGIGGVFILSMALYAVALITVLSIRYRTATRTDKTVAFFTRVAEGLHIVRRDKRLVGALVITVIFNVFGWPVTSMVPVIGQDSLLLDPRGIGILASMDGLGAFCGALTIAAFGKPSVHTKLYFTGTIVYLLALPVFALMRVPLLAGGILFVTGLAGAAFMVTQTTLVYALAPGEARSRVFGVLAVCIGLGPVGFVHVGLMADWWGAPHAVAAIGIEGLVITALTTPLWRALLRP